MNVHVLNSILKFQFTINYHCIFPYKFLEGMQAKYHKAAEEAGVHIVGACGYDSIPAEMGLVHMIKNFKGLFHEVNGVDIVD